MPMTKPITTNALLAIVREEVRPTAGSERSLQRWAAAGRIPSAELIGGRWYFDEDTVRLWVRAKRPGPARGR